MRRSQQSNIMLAFTAVYLIWGSTYLAIRIGVESLPPFLMIGARFLIGGAVLCVWMRARGVDEPSRKHWLPAAVSGLLLPAGGTGLVAWGAQTVPSGLTALLVATAPFWILLADWFRRGGRRPTLPTVLGVLLGFAGIALLIDPTGLGQPTQINKLGAAAILVATLSWAIGSIYSRHAPQPASKVLATGMQMIAGGIVLLVAALLTGELDGFDPAMISLRSWLAFGYLTVAGSVAFAAYVWLLSATTPARVATYAYVNPIVALVLGCLLAGEELTGWTLVCAAIVIGAVILTITARRPAAQPLCGGGSLAHCEISGSRRI